MVQPALGFIKVTWNEETRGFFIRDTVLRVVRKERLGSKYNVSTSEYNEHSKIDKNNK